MAEREETAPFKANAMMEEMRAKLETDEAEGKLAGLTVGRLQDAMSHPKAQTIEAYLDSGS